MANEQLYNIGVKAVIRNEQGKVLVLSEFRRSDQYTYWGLPGGRIGQGEEALDALKREVSEETGIADLIVDRPLIMALSGVKFTNQDNQIVGIIFWVHACSTKAKPEEIVFEENTSGKWCSVDDAIELLSTNPDYPRQILDAIKALKGLFL